MLIGFGIRCDALLKAIHADTARVPTFVGIKFSSPVRGVFKNGHDHDLRLPVLFLVGSLRPCKLHPVCGRSLRHPLRLRRAVPWRPCHGMQGACGVVPRESCNEIVPRLGTSQTTISPLAHVTCQGAVGSTYNYAGRAGNAMIAAWERGDVASARVEQAKIQVRFSPVSVTTTSAYSRSYSASHVRRLSTSCLPQTGTVARPLTSARQF